MAPAHSKLNGQKGKGKGKSDSGSPNKAPKVTAVIAATVLKPPPPSANNDGKLPASPAPVSEIVVATTSPGSSNNNAASTANTGSSSSNSSTLEVVKKDRYADVKRKLKKHKTPRSAKKRRKQKRALPKPGDGRVNRIYTAVCADSSIIVFIMHKRKVGEHAFTKTIDEILGANANIRETMGIDNLFLRVDPDNGNEPWGIEYVNKDKETRVKYATIYHRKPSGESTKAKREKWARRVLVKYFNKYGSAQYAQKEWGAEKFEYGGDLETTKWTDYLSDYITYASVATVMKEDLCFGENPLSLEKMAEDDMLVEMYYGPDKIQEGKQALLSLAKGTGFSTGETDTESNGKPYESESDDNIDELLDDEAADEAVDEPAIDNAPADSS